MRKSTSFLSQHPFCPGHLLLNRCCSAVILFSCAKFTSSYCTRRKWVDGVAPLWCDRGKGLKRHELASSAVCEDKTFFLHVTCEVFKMVSRQIYASFNDMKLYSLRLWPRDCQHSENSHCDTAAIVRKCISFSSRLTVSGFIFAKCQVWGLILFPGLREPSALTNSRHGCWRSFIMC